MAKMFYSLEEAATKLGVSQEEVRDMAQKGRIQEFRDRDKLMFKVDQIDLLAEPGGDEADMSGVIPLADSTPGAPGLIDSTPGASSLGTAEYDLGGGTAFPMAESGMGLAGSGAGGSRAASSRSGTGSGITDPESKAKTGVSIFDADELDRADPSAVTQMSEGGLDELALEPLGSGSGLLDLTRESDDTSLGAVDFLQDIGEQEERRGGAKAPAAGVGVGGTGLFEGVEEITPASMGAGVAVAGASGGLVMVAEPFDGAGSGLVAGLSLGAVLALAVGLVVILMGMMNVGDGAVTSMIAKNYWAVIGGLAGVTLIAGGLGFVLGKRS